MGRNSEYNGENAVDMKDRLKQANKQGQEGVEEKKLLPLPALVPHARARLTECHYLLMILSIIPFSHMEGTQLPTGDQCSAVSAKP